MITTALTASTSSPDQALGPSRFAAASTSARRSSQSGSTRLSGSTSEYVNDTVPWYRSGTPGDVRRTANSASELAHPGRSVRWTSATEYRVVRIEAQLGFEIAGE